MYLCKAYELLQEGSIILDALPKLICHENAPLPKVVLTNSSGSIYQLYYHS